jgi:hypothetical protein
MMRITNYAALASAKRNIDYGTFPGHPHGECPDRVDCLMRVKSNSAFAGTTRIIVLDTKSTKYFDCPVIHSDRYIELIFPHWIAEQITCTAVQTKEISRPVKLGLSHGERIKRFTIH